MKLSDRMYDVLKFVAQYALPGLGTLYFGLSKVWNLPYTEQIVGTIMALDAFLGALLNISNAAYEQEEAMNIRINKAMGESIEDDDYVEAAEETDTHLGLGLFISKEAYDALYWVAQVLLPSLGTLYFAMAALWKLPYGAEILGTITVVDTFLGGLLGFTMVKYYRQELVRSTASSD